MRLSRTFPADFRKQLSISRLLPSFMASIIFVLVDVSLYISLAALIFNGLLAAYLPNGIGFFFFGACVFTFVVAVMSSYSGTISVPQDVTAVILGLIVAGISTQMAPIAGPDTIFITAVAAMGLTTLLAGALFLLLGHFKLGNLIRFIPYPVIGGFLAGTGLLLVRGGLGVMSEVPSNLSVLSEYFSPSTLVRWLPAVLGAFLLLVAVRRYNHFLIVPGFVLAGIVVFYLLTGIAGLNISQVIQAGFLFEPFPKGMLFQPFQLNSISQVHWPSVLGQSSNIAIACLIATLSLLLNATSIELAVDKEINLNRELTAAGVSNLMAGLGGSPIGFAALSFSILNQKVGGASRMTGILTSLMLALVILFGAPVVELFPIPVLGGLLLFLGLALIAEWLYDGWFKLSAADYLMVFIIMVTMNIWGPLAGVGLGITLAAALFVLKYSQVKVIKHALSGEVYHSTVDRPAGHRAYLRQHGGKIQIFELQGFLFFGTAQILLEEVRRHASLPNRLSEFILIDFRRVSGCDSSAMMSFQRIAQLSDQFNFLLAFTQLSPSLRQQFDRNGITIRAPETQAIDTATPSSSPGRRINTFPTLDAGMEYYENKILEAGGIEITETPVTLLDALALFCPPGQDTSRLLAYMEKLEVEQGYLMMRQGEASDALYYLESGSATIYLELQNGQETRLRTLRSGSFVGEIGYYTASPRTASVMTLEPSVLYRLTYPNFEILQVQEPEIGAALHRWLAALLAERVTDNVKIISALAK